MEAPENRSSEGQGKYRQKKNKQEQNRANLIKKAKKWAIILGILCLIGIIALVGFITAVGYGAFGKLATVEELQAIKNPVASEVYSSDGKLLGKYYFENRTNVKFEEISPFVVNALVATEDARFFEHKGVDTKSVLRVLIKTILMGNRKGGGGSTINQQLIKNLYKRDNYGFLTIPVNKTKEIIVGKRLEKVFGKNDIITHYLNTVPFGERTFGIEAAAQKFFGSSAKKLSLEEAATLIGLLKATTSYNPRLHPERSKTRRNTVINQMVKYGYVSEAVGKAAKALPVNMDKYNPQTHNDGLAPHFRTFLKKELKDWCKVNKKKDGSNYNLFTDGLKIYTTIDSRMQDYAEKAVVKHMIELQKSFDQQWSNGHPWGSDKSLMKNSMRQSSRYKKMKAAGKSDSEIDRSFSLKSKMNIFTLEGEKQVMMTPSDSIAHYLRMLNTGFMVMDHKTGQIKAWVGSINHEYFPYDHTTGVRQVGSTFKPVVYAAALESGFEPCTYYPNELRTYIDEYNKEWTPRNSDGKYEGEYSMKGALANSVNTVSVQILHDVGLDSIIQLGKSFGIESEIPRYPSIALGTPDFSLQEMLKVYGAFANGGYKVQPKYLAEIKDERNISLDRFSPYTEDMERVINANTAQMMVEMLQGVVDSGTARRLRFRYNLTQDIGGKTGTTQNQTDGWFMGFTPDLVAGVWTGGQTRMIRFNSIELGQGANMALPIFGLFLKNLYNDPNFQDLANNSFAEVSEDESWRLDCEMWRLYAPVVDTLDEDEDFRNRLDEWLNRNKNKNQDNKVKDRSTKVKPKSNKNNRPKKPKNNSVPPKKKESLWKRIFGSKN